MAKAEGPEHEEEDEEVEGGENNFPQWKKSKKKTKFKEIGLSCMLNTEVGTVLAVIRRSSEYLNSQFLGSPEENYDSSLQNSLKSLRALVFNPQQEWCIIDPSIYLSPFLSVIQSDEIPAIGTGIALSAILKILKLEIFNNKTPGARDAIHSVVDGIINCRLEKTEPGSEDAIFLKIMQVLVAIMKTQASILLTDNSVCNVLNTCFQIVQQTASRGDLLQKNACHAMHELIQTIFARLPEIEVSNGGFSESDTEEGENDGGGYGAGCMVDIFCFLCSLLSVVEVVDSEGFGGGLTSDEDLQLFALVLISSAIEMGGEGIGKHPKLLQMIQDNLFYHLIHYGFNQFFNP